MAVKVAQVIEAVEKLAPKRFAEAGDKTGLQLGNPAAKAERIMVTLDLPEAVVDRAIAERIDMIVMHHPFIYMPLADIREDLPAGRKIARLIRANISVYTAHTNYDSCVGGMNDVIAQRLGLRDVEVLSDKRSEKLFKLEVYVPATHCECLKAALFAAGAGEYAGYRECSFVSSGTGSFRPLPGSQPFTGAVGELAVTEEYKIEAVLPEHVQARVAKALLKTHPYEQPAYSFFEIAAPGKAVGLGRIGRLAEKKTLREFAGTVKRVLAATRVSYCGDADRLVEKIALCSGSGGSLLHTAIRRGADVYLSAEFANHQFVDAVDYGIALVETTHFASENVMPGALARYLRGQAVENKWKIKAEDIICNDFSEDYMRVV